MNALAATPLRPPCRQCGNAAPRDLGGIPPAAVFAGQPLDPPWPGGRLYRCPRCHLAFRHPVRSDAEYEGLYEKAPGTIWLSAGLRVDQRLVCSRIEAACPGPGRVLDVGCYDGNLLAALPPRLRRCGVEASAMAADAARRRGVEIVAGRISTLPALGERFEVVCAVDVIEHVGQPLAFVALLAGLLVPGGTLLISTGAADAPAWRAAGGRYWYCSFPEHISFVSPAWARAAAPGLGLELLDVQRFAYELPPQLARAKARRRFWRKLALARLADGGRACVGRARAPSYALGQPGLFEDHVLLVLRAGAGGAT